MTKYLCTIEKPISVITPIDDAERFPEILSIRYKKYQADIDQFYQLVMTAESSAELLGSIRSRKIARKSRTSLLKMFRRCVAPVVDTEMAGKITKVSTTD